MTLFAKKGRCPHCGHTNEPMPTRAALTAPPAPAVPAEPTGWICRRKQEVTDAERAFPGEPHDYLWKYTHGTRHMAECEGYGDFDVVRLYAAPQPAPQPTQED